MKALVLAKLAQRNLARHWRRSLSATAAVAAGITALSLFDGFVAGLLSEHAEAFRRRFMLGDVIVQRHAMILPESEEDSFTDGNDRGGLEPRDQAIVDRFLAERRASVETSMRFLKIAGVVMNGRTSVPFKGYGIDVERAAQMRGPHWADNALAGVPLQQAHVAAPLLVGRGLATLLSCEANAPMALAPDRTSAPPLHCERTNVQLVSTTVNGQLNAAFVDVVGIMDSGFSFLDQIWVNVPLEVAQDLYDTHDVSMYTIALRDGTPPLVFARELVEAARREGTDLSALPWQKHPLGRIFEQITSLLAMVRTLLLVVIAAVAAMAVSNSFYKLVSERTREIGTLRAMGFRPGDVVGMLLLESAFSLALAAFFAVASTTILASGIDALRIRYDGGLASLPILLSIELDQRSVWRATLSLIAVALLAALLPARRASRLEISQALTFS